MLGASTRLNVIGCYQTVFICFSGFTATLRTVPSRGLYMDDSNRFKSIHIHCIGGEGKHLGWRHNGIDVNKVGKCNDTEHRTICPNWVKITTFRNEYAGQYTCYNSRTHETAKVSIGGDFLDFETRKYNSNNSIHY